MTSPDGTDLGQALDELARTTDRLLATVDQLDDADLRKPSLLPGWTRAHVLTHVARNADGLANVVQWARTGEETPMYPKGRAGRDADIEAGSRRHIGDIRLDVADSAERLLGSFADFPVAALEREVRLGSGADAFGWELPLVRIREVEIHHADLDAGYGPADWSASFVRRTLDQLAPQFRARGDCPVARLTPSDVDGGWDVAPAGPQLTGPASALLAWLTGRSDGAGLDLDGGGTVPRAPRWA